MLYEVRSYILKAGATPHFEEEFEIEIPDEEAESIQTVKNAVDYINSNS